MSTSDALFDGAADLDAVNATVELERRPMRLPDHAAENRALVALAQHVATSPEDVLQKLAETALELCRAGSAGVSVLETEGGRRALRRHALAASLAGASLDAISGDAGPCAEVLARNAPMLFAHPARHYTSLSSVAPAIEEALVVPFAVGGERMGTLWVAAHAPGRGFDAEDARLLGNLAQLGAAALRATRWLHVAEEAQRDSQQLEATLRNRGLQFRRLLDALPVGAYTCDPNGLITYHNQQAVRLWGRAPKLRDASVRYCGSLKLFTSDGAPIRHDECWVARAIRDQEPCYAEEVVIERPDGSRVAALAHASPIRDENGTPLGAVNILVDISDRKKTEEALKESEHRFARFMERLPGLAWIKGLDGRYLFVNEAAERAFGKTRAELYGRTDDEIFPPPTAAQFHANDLQALASATGVEAIETLEHADGLHHSLVSKFPIPGADGKPALIGGIAIDITERIRAEEALRSSEQIYRAIGESIDYGVWVCDPQGRNTYASESFLKLVGLTQERCSNLGWGDVLHPEDAERTLAAWQECVRTGQEWDVEHRFRGVDGHWHPVLARGVRVQNERGETTGWAGINLDISRQKQVEEELREADRRKDEFLATLAHELRNPLAPIRNSLLVLRLAGDGLAAERVHQMMERQVDQMVRLVDDLLEVSRITRGKIELRRERVELDAVVRAAVETSRPLVEGARHRLEISLPGEPLVLEADPVRLAQVFSNLLNNAAKYTEEGGRIALEVRREGDEVVVAVRDNGVGIPADQIPEVFELFTQVDSTLGRAQGGLGIGLTLVKRLVQLHDGRVEVYSGGPGTGSEFRVTLPLAATPPLVAAGQVAAPEPISSVAAPRRILVVDDNQDAADSLGMLLRMLGVEAHVAHDGATALELLTSFRPAMALLDLGMPGMDGYEVARRIRERPDGAALLLIALTGWGQPDDRRRTREAGFDHHLVKPVELAALQSLVALLDAPVARRAR